MRRSDWLALGSGGAHANKQLDPPRSPRLFTALAASPLLSPHLPLGNTTIRSAAMDSIVAPEVGVYGITRGPGKGANDSPVLNKYSREITQGAERGGAQAMLHGAGLTVEDLDKAQVGISSVWWEGECADRCLCCVHPADQWA